MRVSFCRPNKLPDPIVYGATCYQSQLQIAYQSLQTSSLLERDLGDGSCRPDTYLLLNSSECL